MGCCGSTVPKFDLITNRTLQELGASKFEIKMLFRLFSQVAAGGNGVIQAAQFFEYFDLQPSPINKLIFSCYDLEEKGVMNFIQFVCTLWSLFTLPPEQIGSFVFFIFDTKKCGEIPFSEVLGMARQLHRKHYAESPALQALVIRLLEGPGAQAQLLGAEAFVAWSAANPDVCRPMLGQQIDMMEKALSASFWKGMRRKRAKVARLSEVHHVYRFMRKICGNHKVLQKRALSGDYSEQNAAEVGKAVVSKTGKAAVLTKSNSRAEKPARGGQQQASYFDVDDIDQLMDGFAIGREAGDKSGAAFSLKKKGSGKSGRGGRKGGRKGNKVAALDHHAAVAATGAKELPPLVLKALQKGTLSSAAIAPMDNYRSSGAARSKLQQDRESELSSDEKRRIHAAKAAKYNRAMSNEYNLFN